MSDPYLAEIRYVSFNFAPKGWALCNGQLMAINQNQALYALLGKTYGGDGVTTFALPDLRGRVPVHVGGDVGWGQQGGAAQHTLTTAEIPAHTHQAYGARTATATSPTNTVWASAPSAQFGETAQGSMRADAVAASGNGQPHNNLAPSLVITAIIALQGIFPTHN